MDDNGDSALASGDALTNANGFNGRGSTNADGFTTAQPNKDEMGVPLAVRNDGDNSSIASSNGAPASIFSIKSQESSATDWSKASTYSEWHIQTATQELVSILQADEELQPLFTAAIRSDIIGPQRFANNFRRLLKRYSGNLKDEAKDRLDYLAAQLVALKARQIAESILRAFHQDTVVPKLARRETELDLESSRHDDSSDEEEHSVVEERDFQDLTNAKEFLVESNALQILRSELREFVHPPKSIKKQVKQSREPSFEPVSTEINEATFLNYPKFFTAQVHSALERVLNGILLQLGISESPCPPQKRRVRWKCVRPIYFARCNTRLG